MITMAGRAPMRHEPAMFANIGVAVDPRPLTPEQFEAVYDRHGDDVFAYFARRVSRSDAEDLTAQTFLEGWAHRDRFDPDRGSEIAWLSGIASNLLRRHHRRGRRFDAAVIRLDRTPSPAHDDVDRMLDRHHASEEAAALSSAWASLDDDDRRLLEAAAEDDVTYQDLAQRFDVPVGTIRSRLSRTRRRLAARVRRGEDRP